MKNRELDWPELLEIVSRFASSSRAKEVCLQLGPLPNAGEAFEAANDVLDATALLSESEPPDFSAIDLVPPILERLHIHAVLDVKELVDFRQFLNTAVTLKLLLRTRKSRWTDSLSSKLADFKPQISAINHVVAMNGDINEDASPALASLSEERRRLQREISRTLDGIIARRQMESYLQDKYVTNREGRMVIPVKSGNQHDVKGLIHDASQTKQTVFMEPEEVVPLNNRLREVQILIQEEIARILRELSDYLARFESNFVNGDKVLLQADTVFAQARFNQKIKGTAVTFSVEGEFTLKDLRHPLLVVQGIDVVSNTVTLNKTRRLLLLSGPNAGGKTILLKSIGLAAQMARSGFPVCAGDGSVLPFFKNIDPIIGDLQSVDQNLSSFSSHIARLNGAVKLEGPANLVLVDEILGATDPEEGAALARSFIESFCQNMVYAVVTSHLGPLKENWPAHVGVEHGSLEFDTKTSRPTFQLLIGIPGRSLALSVAQRLGVPEAIIEKARGYLTPESRKRVEHLQEIEGFKQSILQMKEEMQRDRDEAKRAKEQYQELIRKFREQRDKWLEKAIEKADKKIANLIEDARQDRLKNKSLYDIKSELPEIVKAKPLTNKPQSIEDFRAQFKPGTPAFSTRLGRQVLVQSEPDSKGQVTVLADSMRVQLPWHGLASMNATEEKTQTVVRRSSPAARATADGDGEGNPELDLRGKRIDDAIPLLEKWLDDCMRNQQDNLKIIHGFGTEQLKKAIRQYLSKSRYVSKWTPGDSQSGGDGITWVSLA